jgi:apolipoprotein N-acyltransferase
MRGMVTRRPSALLQASLRSIEQGRYLARAANTGISGFVDPHGRVVQQSEFSSVWS